MEKVEGVCPKCGSHLIIREGEYNEFLACPRFPDCRYTESLYGKEPEMYEAPQKFCKQCNHTGLIPFIKNEKVIANAWIDCICKQPETERYQSIKVEDFDFSMSDTFRAFSYRYCGMPDPAEPPVTIKESLVRIVPQKITVKHHYINSSTLKKRVKKYD